MLRILLVEDDPDVAFVVSALLESADFHVTVASDGQQGLEIAMQERPELIITDFMMPVMSGLDMIGRLRAQGYERPIILCSAVAEESMQRDRYLYDVFLLKPYRSEELMSAIDRVRTKPGP
ncbi:response regulator [Dyella sp.]|uniref:response regulator n=1 Tax=Dyella sp. TaxID=1869338 RepID=UPI002ED0479B